jgi:hypothetical protein
MSAQVAQVLVRPGRAGLPIEPGLRMISVPSQAKPVAVCTGRRLQSPETLRYKRMLRLSDIVFEGCCFPSIGNPAAHGDFLKMERQGTVRGGAQKTAPQN